MATELLTGLIAIAIGIALVVVIRGKAGGEPRFLRNSSWLIVYPVLPLFFFVMGAAQLIRVLA